MKNSNDVDIEMNPLKGKLITTGTTQTPTTTMSGVRTRRISKLPLTTVDSSNLSNLMRLNRPKEELIFGPMRPHFLPLKTPYSKIWQAPPPPPGSAPPHGPAPPPGPPPVPPGPKNKGYDQNYFTSNQPPPKSAINATSQRTTKR